MTIAELMKKMIEFSTGNLHDIDHFMLVWSYAKTIGELERLDPEEQFVLEAAAIVHDIACPLCREKYGNTNGKLQEREGMVLAEAFLRESGLSDAQRERIVSLVGRHHTFSHIDGRDYQILLEADYIVNAAENAYPPENVRNFADKICKTDAGRDLLRSIYGV